MLLEKKHIEQLCDEGRIFRQEAAEAGAMDAYIRMYEADVFFDALRDSLITFSEAEARKRNLCSDSTEQTSSISDERRIFAKLVGQLDVVYFRVKCPHCNDVAFTCCEIATPAKFEGHTVYCRKCSRFFSSVYNLTEDNETNQDLAKPQNADFRITESKSGPPSSPVLSRITRANSPKKLDSNLRKKQTVAPEEKAKLGCVTIGIVWVCSFFFVAFLAAVYTVATGEKRAPVTIPTIALATSITYLLKKQKKQRIENENRALRQRSAEMTKTPLKDSKINHNTKTN